MNFKISHLRTKSYLSNIINTNFKLFTFTNKYFATKTIKREKTFLKKDSSKMNTSNNDNNLNNDKKKYNKVRKEDIQVNLLDEKFNKTPLMESLDQKSRTQENYAAIYYKYDMGKEFNLFNLRNLLYTYIFVKQRNGNIYLNIGDTYYKVIIKQFILFL
jgi:hypothetical protein